MPLDRPCKFRLKEKENDTKKSKWKIKKIFKNRDSFRSVFLEMVNIEPCIVSEIIDKFIISRSTVYRVLNSLQRLGVVGRIKVSGVLQKGNLGFMEKRVKKKFEVWSKTMSDKTKDYYGMKAGYWYITEYGESFIEWCSKIEGVEIKENPNLSSLKSLGKP